MIRFVFRWLFRLLILAIVLVVALLLLKDTLAKAALEYQVRRSTGLEVRTTRVEAGLGQSSLAIEGLKLFNPADFGGGLLLDVPELYLDYDRDALIDGRLRFRLVRLALKELQIVRSSAGKTNVASLVGLAQEAAPWTAHPAGRDLVFDGIDALNLSVGTVRYTDLAQPSRSRVLNLNLEGEIFENLRTESDAILVLFKLAVRRGFQAWLPVPSQVTNAPAAAPPNRSVVPK